MTLILKLDMVKMYLYTKNEFSLWRSSNVITWADRQTDTTKNVLTIKMDSQVWLKSGHHSNKTLTKTYPIRYFGHFWNMSLFYIPGPFKYFSEKGYPQKITFYSEMHGYITSQFDSQSKTLRRCYGLSKVEYHFFDTLMTFRCQKSSVKTFSH